MPAAVDEMASTPNASQGAVVDGSGSASDKKRNKLGYHRTSVACVHCRRRKIRCLVAADDPQGRCENCIRLRKECQFFPVDQQPPVEKKSRPDSRLETPATDRSTSTPVASSPTNLGPDSVEAFYPYPTIPLNTSGQDMSSFNAAAFPGHPMQGFTPERPIGPGDFSGHQAMNPGVPWEEFTTMSDPQMLPTMTTAKGQMMNLAPNAWNSGTMSSGLQPTSPMSATSPMAGQGQPMNPPPAFAMQPDGTVWPVPQPPARAMSYPGQEMGSSYSNHFQPQMSTDLKRRMTTPAHALSTPTAASPQGSHGADMQAPPGSVSYAGQTGMGLASWPDMSPVPGMMPYPMFTGDAVQHPPYTSSPPPMGHPGAPGRSSGS